MRQDWPVSWPGWASRSCRHGASCGLAAHLSRWLAAAGLGTAALTGPVVEAYLAARRAAGYTRVPDTEGAGAAAGLPAAGWAWLRSRCACAGRPRRKSCWRRTAATCWPSVACRPKVARGYLDLGPPVRGRSRGRRRGWAAGLTARRCHGVPDRRVAAAGAEDRAAAGDRAAVAAAVLASAGPDQRAAGPGGAQGRQPPAGASPAAGARPGAGACWLLATAGPRPGAGIWRC